MTNPSFILKEWEPEDGSWDKEYRSQFVPVQAKPEEVVFNLICDAVRAEAEAFVAAFLESYGLVLDADDEAALIQHACSFFANFGADGSAHDVLWRYLCRRLDEQFPLATVEFGHEA